jgi:hypothetical protein
VSEKWAILVLQCHSILAFVYASFARHFLAFSGLFQAS